MSVQQAPTVIRDLRGVRWWLGPSIDPDRAAPLLAAAVDAVEAGARNLKAGRRKELYPLALLGADPDHLLKITRYQHGSPWTRRVRKSKARRELEIATRLQALQIHTPLPIAAGESRRAGVLTACYLLVPLDRDAVDLAAFAKSLPTPSARHSTTTKFGALVRRLHAIGFRQADFAPNNFLLRPSKASKQSEIVPIDFERANLAHRGGPLDRHERLQSLAKLERHCVDATAADRLRFLLAYADDRRDARRYWHEIERAIAELFAHDHSRLRRISTSGARRTERYRVGDWEGWARRGARGIDAVEKWLARNISADRIDTRPEMWVCSYREQTDPPAGDLWATAQALWIRGQLAPEPICTVKRGSEIRLFLDRKFPVPSQETSERAAQTSGSAAERDAVPGSHDASVSLLRLIDRLLRLGELGPEIGPESVVWERRADGSWRAMLVDVAMLRPGQPTEAGRRSRAREISDRLLVGYPGPDPTEEQ